MQKIEQSITIDAPVERVFAYWADPTNQPEVWPSLIEVKDVEPLPNGGYKHGWVYKLAGMRFEGTTETVEFAPNRRIVEITRGGIESTLTYSFEPEGSSTRLTASSEYTVPVPLLGKLAERLILKQNEGETALILANLKARMEA